MSNFMRDEEGWRFDPFNDGCSCRTDDAAIDVDVVNDRIKVVVEGLLPFDIVTASFTLPIEMLTKVLEHAGYNVSKRPPREELDCGLYIA